MKKIFLFFVMLICLTSCELNQSSPTVPTIVESVEFVNRDESVLIIHKTISNVYTATAKCSVTDTADYNIFVVGDTVEVVSKRYLRNLRNKR